MTSQPEMKYPYKAGTGWGFMRFMDISDDENPNLVYLRRFIIFKTPLCALYLHWIFTTDHDRDPHNHPFPFLSMIVKGGYTEWRWKGDDSYAGEGRDLGHTPRRRYRWSFARTTRKDFHSINHLVRTPTITLVFCGPRSPEGWGFLTNEGYVDQAEYIRGKEARWAERRDHQDHVHTSMRLLPSEEHTLYTQRAADVLNGQVVTVEDESGKREVGHVVRARVVDDGRAIEASIEIGDKALCDRLRA